MLMEFYCLKDLLPWIDTKSIEVGGIKGNATVKEQNYFKW